MMEALIIIYLWNKNILLEVHLRKDTKESFISSLSALKASGRNCGDW